MSTMTIGQYYPAKSIIHRLDPRIKFMSTLIFITMLFFIQNFAGYIWTFLYLVTIISLSTVPVKMLLRSLRSIYVIIILTFLINVFLSPGDHILFQWGFLVIRTESLVLAFKMATRLLFLVTGSSILTLTTSPIQLTDAIEYLLKPFKKIGVPAHEIAMMMTISLRFIPTLIEELDKIMKAQKARGADFETGGILKKAKGLVPILVPLFLSSFRRADELAIAMEARCYRGDIHRTKMKQMHFEKIDGIAILVIAIFSLGIVMSRRILFF